MLVSARWLADYVDHDLSPEDLAHTLTMGGLEIEGVDYIGQMLDGVVVGHVLEVTDHPNADRLRLCRVDLGNGEPVQIVCGAPNVAARQRVPVATVGTTLMMPSRSDPEELEPMEIKKAKIRGERSFGMICSEDELGLSDDHEGIMVLEEDAEIGVSFRDYLAGQQTASRDAILDIALTPNRADAASHLGVARDVAALTEAPLTLPEIDMTEAEGEAGVSVSIEAPEACPRYVGLVVRGVEIGPSPLWLRRKLEAIGLRPRNNVVDVTNFVLHEMGQPLHAFDLGELAGPAIEVRLTEEETSFTTLDDVERTVPEGSLMICDAERPVAIAGIMGGADSEVSEQTTDILIESAYFDPSTIRRTASALNLQTDSSYRFERGVDTEMQLRAAFRAARLIEELAGGTIEGAPVDERPFVVPQKVIELRPSRVERVLGITLPEREIRDMLAKLGFQVRDERPDGTDYEYVEAAGEQERFYCVVPTFRPDVHREEDLIEEVARLFGYDRIPEQPSTTLPNRLAEDLPADRLRNAARGLLVGFGFREIYTNSLLPEATAERFNQSARGGATDEGPVATTLNPVSEEMAALRPSLLPGALKVLQHNYLHGQRSLRIAEWGHVFRQTDRDGVVVPGYAEHESLLLAQTGPVAEASWDTDTREADFFDLKGIVEALLRQIGVVGIRIEQGGGELAHAAYHAIVLHGETELGTLFRLSDETAEAFDLESDLFVAELDWQMLVELAVAQPATRYASISKFPTVDRDLAVVVAKSENVGPMLDAIREAGGPLLQRASIFDLYEGEHLPENRKSVAFSMTFGTGERTLTDADVDARMKAILSALEEGFGAALRE